MEVKEKSKKRELIKTIAIIFLAVLLVLTFFSGTIMNYSLPEVATQLVSSGTINAKIRGSGTLAANESYDVMLEQTREIRSVCVKVGDTVAEGDLLFVLGDVESEELKTAQEALEKARISYQEQVLNFSKGYAEDNQKVKELRQDLEKAMAERDANYVTDEQVSFAKGDLAAAKTQQSQVEFTLKELQALLEEDEEYKEADAEVTRLKTEVDTLTKEIEGYEEQLGGSGGAGETDYAQNVSKAQAALTEAQTAWNNDYTANSEIYKKLIGNVITHYSGKENAPASLSDSQTITTTEFMRQDSYVQTYLANDPNKTEEEDRVYKILLADQTAIDTANKALAEARTAMQNANQSTFNQQSTIRNKLNTAQANLSTAQSQLRAAQQRLDTASSANSQVKEQIRLYEASQRQMEQQVTQLDETLKDLEAKQTAYKDAVTKVETAQRSLESAMTGDGIDKQLNNLTLQSLSMEIEKQQELVDKYKKDSVDAEIHAPVSGVVSSISVNAGKKTDPSTALAVIDVVDRGYIIKISVTNEQAKQVKVGDTAEVTNYYWGGDVSAVLEQIAPDPESGGQKKLLVFRVSGDIDAGTNVTLSIGQRSANFDTIVPKSAVRQDSNGKFVLVVTAKSTPLGNRYTATRADVQVLAEDDTSAAVSGLAASDYVITTSTKPLDPGSQVRMVENP